MHYDGRARAAARGGRVERRGLEQLVIVLWLKPKTATATAAVFNPASVVLYQPGLQLDLQKFKSSYLAADSIALVH